VRYFKRFDPQELQQPAGGCIIHTSSDRCLIVKDDNRGIRIIGNIYRVMMGLLEREVLSKGEIVHPSLADSKCAGAAQSE